MSTNPHVVIIGCGFAGLAAACTLAGKPVAVTIVDRTNHHLFQPLLYQVATAGLAAPAIAAPIRHILREARNITTLLAEVTSIDLARRKVCLDQDNVLEYDHLIVAAGACHSYFGHEEWASFAPGLKTLDDALEIRRRILLAFERAERETSPEARRAWLSFVVVGAGSTGVELAGTLAEIARETLRREFRHIDPMVARIILLEGSHRVLQSYPEDLSEKACKQLERLHVEIRTDSRVTGVDSDGISLGGERLPARTVVWAAGVRASPVGYYLGAEHDGDGRIRVQLDLSLSGHPEVFVVGDLANVESGGRPVPGVAPAAKQMGQHAARNLLRQMVGKPTRPFLYRDYGSLATIGRNAAVASLGRLRLWGKPAWLLWLCAHVYFLIGFRNRLVVMLDWAWAYWTSRRHARVVLGIGGK
ncbi:MAG: NAD(P)/FAD-dependent oxidoreductase [Gammaproteobacteria bacterium]|nr:NAD(P)/FAD-dependent oxidoreductase [Gammaproteobacteria bacterium]MCP5195399.1 NAD(P)/FAD-dependent oxidoreductase [Gammaproteobacteria bacterium]